MCRISYLITIYILISGILGQNDIAINDRLNSFAINMLSKLHNEAGNSLNIAVSPYTIWTLLLVLAEGANNNTLRELEAVLNIPKDKAAFREEFNRFANDLMQEKDGVNLDLSNAIFTTSEQKLRPSFQKIAKTYYQATVEPTDFKDTSTAVKMINSYVNKATRGRIHELVNENDLYNAAIFLTSVLYFKGLWSKPFNESMTLPEYFYDEQTNQPIGNVSMMHQISNFPFTRIDRLKAFALELPYGESDQMSMIIILPYGRETIANVLNLMANERFSKILDDLNDSQEKYGDSNVEVFLPKFKANSDFTLNIILSQMGIQELFNPTKAELLGIFPHYLHVSKVLHRGEIEVEEKGTVASAVSGASVAYKTTIPRLKANKPFLYFIVNKPTKSILFYGRITNPNTLK